MSMNYKEFAEHPNFSSRAKVAEWVETAATVIVKLLARAEAAEARVRELEKLLSAVQNMENFHPDETGFFVFTKKDADDITGKLLAAEARSEKAERAVAYLMEISPQERITTCFGHPIDRVMELV